MMSLIKVSVDRVDHLSMTGPFLSRILLIVNPVLRGQPETQPIVIQLAEQDCSYGDGTYPDLESGCEKYYVCNGDRVRTQDKCLLSKI